MADIDIRPARGAADLHEVRTLFREYQEWLGVDLCFQGFERELADLPGCYAPPAGEVFLARDGDAVAGTVAMRPVGDPADGRSEMKRLFVRERWRGCGLGRRLAERIVAQARDSGYRSMVLDTLPKLAGARALYESMGFRETAPYYENPLPGALYMEKLLV